MLIKFIIENFQVYNNEVELNLEADLRTKKFLSNVIKSSQGNILKTAALYGPNNTGKSCLLNAIRTYKNVILNKRINIYPNLFTDSTIIKLGAVFLYNEKRYRYFFKYDTKTKTFVEEDFSELHLDEHGNETKKIFYYRNITTKTTESSCQKLKEVMNLSSKDNILINTLDSTELPLLDEAKSVLKGFANQITILSMQSVPPNKTIEILKNPNSLEAKQIVEIIKNSDLDIDDFKYDEALTNHILNDLEDENEKNKGTQYSDKTIEMLKLTSFHRGKPLPSFVFDSLGTKKIVSLAGYLVEKLNNGGCLFVDELDSGLHFKLSRAIVSLFNSVLNEKTQLLFSTHDASLLDIKTLFRKEQIWFTSKDEEQVYLYSLSNFTAQNSGIRTANILECYSKGLLGALPDPSLIDALLIKGDGVENE